MRLIKREALIVLPDRQRQSFIPEAHEELKNSIESLGLLHAIVIRETPEGPVLVAGERRKRAIEDIFDLGGSFAFNGESVPPGFFPCVTLGELTHLEAEEAELDENLKRKDLTWQEHAAATARLHKLRVAQSAERTGPAGAAPGNILPVKEHTIADTARELYPEATAGKADGELGDAQAKVRKEILVAKHLDNPVIAKAKSADEAFKLLKAAEQAKKNAVLAASVALDFSAKSHRLIRGDCLTALAGDDMAGKFDVILTDPPYGMGADQFGDGGGRLSGIEHRYDDSPESWRTLMAAWAPLAYRVTKPQAHAYVFCDIDRFHELKLFMANAGWDVFRTPLIIMKQNSGRVPRPEVGPRRQWEMLLYAIKGNKPVTHIYPDVIQAGADEQLGHGAQKPVAVYQNLLQRSVQPGDHVLDAFAGSGTIFPACHTLRCKATGIEADPVSQGICVNRLKDLELADQPALL